MTLFRDRSKKWARERMETESCLVETFTMAKEVMTLGFFPDWSLLFILAQAVTANTITRSVQDKPLCHRNLFHTATDAKCTPIELSRTMMMLRKVFHHGMKSGHLNWQMQFMWDGDLQMEHKTFLIGQQEFKILISYTLKLLTPNEKCWVTFLYAFLFPWGISSFLLLYNNFFECFW